MANYSPVILMAMANDEEQSLQLAAEERSIRESLANAHDSDRVEFHSLGHTILTDIISNLNRFNRRVAIFHYCGHSNSEGLHLEDGDAQGQNLSRLFGMAPELQLVFLNGCSNRKQVDLLQKEGVKSIIATSSLIGDEKALHLAKQFYQALSVGKTIKESFDTAKSFLENEYDNFQLESSRGIDFSRTLEDEGEFPWGLYYTDEDSINWRLPLPEQLDETLAKETQTVGGSSMQLDETLKKEVQSIGTDKSSIQGIELESNDRRVQNAAGILRIENEALIGRGQACDIVVLSQGVSRKHARIVKKGGQMMLIDENSTNGTFWNDIRISQMPISADGTLRLDDVEFKIRVINK